MQKHLLSALLIGALVSMPLAATPSQRATSKINDQSVSLPLDDAADEIAAQIMANHYDISLDDARTQMARQDRTISLAEEVAASIPSTWGGSWIDHTKNGTLVLLGTDLDLLNDAASRQTLLDSSLVVTSRVEHSFVELSTINSEIETRLKQAKATYTNVAVNVPNNDVEVRLPSPDRLNGIDPNRNLEVVKSVTASFDPVEISQKGGLMQPHSCRSGFEICDPPLRGGIEIRAFDDPDLPVIAICSTGFIVRSKTDHKPYALTAGHCVTGIHTEPWYTRFDSVDPYRHYIGATWNQNGDANTWPTDDEAILTIDNPTGWNASVKTRVLVVASGGTNPTVRDENYTIDSVGGAAQVLPTHAYLCWTGGTWQTDCARINRTNGNQGILVNDNFGTCEGDSGGAVYVGHKGYGMIVAGDNTTTVNSGTWRLLGPPNVTLNCTAGFDTNQETTYQSLVRALGQLNVELIP